MKKIYYASVVEIIKGTISIPVLFSGEDFEKVLEAAGEYFYTRVLEQGGYPCRKDMYLKDGYFDGEASHILMHAPIEFKQENNFKNGH